MATRAGSSHLQSTTEDPAREAERRTLRLVEVVEAHSTRQLEDDDLGRTVEIFLRPTALFSDHLDPDDFRVAGHFDARSLVHHGSLRRWDRLHDEADRPEDF